MIQDQLDHLTSQRNTLLKIQKTTGQNSYLAQQIKALDEKITRTLKAIRKQKGYEPLPMGSGTQFPLNGKDSKRCAKKMDLPPPPTTEAVYAEVMETLNRADEPELPQNAAPTPGEMQKHRTERKEWEQKNIIDNFTKKWQEALIQWNEDHREAIEEWIFVREKERREQSKERNPDNMPSAWINHVKSVYAEGTVNSDS